MLQQTCTQQLTTLLYVVQYFMQLRLQMTTQELQETLKFHY